MRLLPRRRRAEAKAWTYLAMFGTDDDESEPDERDGDDGAGGG